jgi:hypothetical protein
VIIYFGGGEKPSYRKALAAADAAHVAVNLTNLAIPRRKELVLPEVFGDVDLAVYTSPDDEDPERFDAFVRKHADHLALVIGHPDATYQADHWYPVWNDGEDQERLAWLCEKHRKVAISDKAIGEHNLRRVKTLLSRWEASAVLLSSKPEMLSAHPWSAAVVTSWTSVVRYGETQVWDGSELRRFPAQQKEAVRRRYRAQILRLGVDPDRVIEDNADDVSRLAILSWQAFGAAQTAPYKRPDLKVLPGGGESDEYDLATRSAMAIHPASVSAGEESVAIEPFEMRQPRETMLLPTMGLETLVKENGLGGESAGQGTDSGTVDERVIRTRSESSRICSSCYLSNHCPAFEHDANCAYNIPVEIKTTGQLHALVTAAIEMQAGRVLFARFGEEVSGVGIDTTVSQEIDRLFNLIAKGKEIGDNRDTLRIAIESKSSAGMIERIFGSGAAQQMQALPGGGLNAMQTDRVLGEIIDADVEEP